MNGHHELAAATKSEVLARLKARGARPGETVEFSWLMLRVGGTPNALEIESLDFERMASFTTDLSRALQIHLQQMSLLRETGVQAERCTLQHAGLVSPGYRPGEPDMFLTRIGPAQDSDSGWVIGSVAERLTKASLASSRFVSLYELSLADPRLLPFWLLPSYYTVVLRRDGYELIPPDTDIDFMDDFEADKPWWQFW